MVRPLGRHTGGIIALLRFLEIYGSAVEADFQRYYHIYLGDLFTGKLTWRRFRELLSELPLGSQTNVAVEGPAAYWGLTDELLAIVANILAIANWQRGGGKGRKPEPIEKPESYSLDEEAAEESDTGVPTKNDEVLTQEEFDRIMFGI